MNRKQRGTLRALFEEPLRSDIDWDDVEVLFAGLGAEISEVRGSRVRVHLNGIRAVFHRPHPHATADKGAVKSVRRFLLNAGVKP